ncbi:MAG TPA: GNAT family N-acetyltransferase [Spirochaeta sp.]|nr:GNAT family N-acetyltransferase [Spirochaeta sp.]
MVVLREMRQEEYPAYCEYFIEDYSQEIAQNYGHSMEVAVDLAQKDLQSSFPDGLESTEHSLLCIDAEIEGQLCLIGYLWHSINLKDKSTFIYDFYISAGYRGNGFGKQAIAVLESQLSLTDIHQIKLRVAYSNQRALKLYQDVGFLITGLNMSKNISGS